MGLLREGKARARSFILVSQVDGRDPAPWAIVLCTLILDVAILSIDITHCATFPARV